MKLPENERRIAVASLKQVGRTASLLVGLACLTACAQHPPPNSNCQWPNEAHGKALNLKENSDRQHLSDDAEFAEDLAIRYADSCCKNLDGTFAGADARDTCMVHLFRVIASTHKVSPDEVRRSLGRRRTSFDLAVILSFAVLYGCGARLCVRSIFRTYGAREDLTTMLIMTTVGSLVTSTAGVMLGEVWSGILESLRIGNGHMSYRGTRIPWAQHHLGLFVAGVAIFLLIAAFHRRRAMTSTAGGSILSLSARGTK